MDVKIVANADTSGLYSGDVERSVAKNAKLTDSVEVQIYTMNVCHAESIAEAVDSVRHVILRIT